MNWRSARAQRPDGLADAHFLCAFDGAGRGEVHKIDTGDEEDEQRDDSEQPDILDAAAFGIAIAEDIVQVGLVEALHAQFQPEACVGGPEVRGDEVFDLRLHPGRVDPRLQLNIVEGLR